MYQVLVVHFVFSHRVIVCPTAYSCELLGEHSVLKIPDTLSCTDDVELLGM